MSLESLDLAANFAALDWLIVAFYVLGTVALGMYVNRFVSGMDDFVVAGRSLRSSLSIATMIGSELGLITVMYSAQVGFKEGFAAFHIALVAGVVALLIGLTGFLVVRLRELGVMTIPEFYERRFSRGVRIFGGTILALAGILNMGMFLRAGALFVTGLTGLTDPGAIKIVMTVMLLLVLVYTAMGGMLSVVLTDYVQFIVLTFGLLITTYLAWKTVGWESAVNAVEQVHGEAGFDPTSKEGSFGITYVIWMVFTAGIVSCAVWQTAVLRACSAESTKVVKKLYLYSSIGFVVRSLIPQFLGICALAYFFNNQSTVFFPEGKLITDSDLSLQAMPVFLNQILPTGLIGLMAAAMLAAFMSTHDSYLLCWASVLVQDVWAPVKEKSSGAPTPAERLRLTRILIFTIGAFLLIWSLWYPLKQSLWDYMAISGAIYFNGAFALLALGLYWKRASVVGAYVGLCTGILSVLGIDTLRKFIAGPWAKVKVEEVASLELHQKLLYHYANVPAHNIGLSVAVLAVVLMVIASLLFPNRTTNTVANTSQGAAA